MAIYIPMGCASGMSIPSRNNQQWSGCVKMTSEKDEWSSSGARSQDFEVRSSLSWVSVHGEAWRRPSIVCINYYCSLQSPMMNIEAFWAPTAMVMVLLSED
ncbi:hypothetical protein KP509_24G057300 [Ceratopteris richardii]|uniref:Uncharacterized protein n=1 Tax=Ceratopteris richardii TaxID=49495 RepID=A0A8T2RY47_CERRI|nr:hypothetical protein KP509_24G057300 [Ceratopteris richardii]